MSHLITRKAVEIAAAAAVSEPFTLDGHIPNILEMPAAWDAAGLSFQGSTDGATYCFIYDDTGALVTATTAASHRINLPYAELTNHKYIKVCSGTDAAPVNQTAKRTIYVELWE